MDSQNSSFPAPTTCYKIKSHGNSWLGFDGLKNVKFQKQQEKSCDVILVPYADGRYMLQLYLASTWKLEDFETSCIKECHLSDKPSGGGQGCAESLNGDTWFFCNQGQVMGISNYVQEWHDDFLFFLEFDEHGCVSLSSGLSRRYWRLGSCGHFLVAGQNIPKKETFQLIEYGLQTDKQNSIWLSRAPVRVQMKSHTGRYLCCASTVISAAAEVPCCCEEFLLDMNFPPLPPRCETWNLAMRFTGEAKQGFRVKHSTFSRVRSANGKLNWSAGADGKLITVPVDEAHGHEHFVVELLPRKQHPMVSLSHHYTQNNADPSCYVSVESSSKLVCNKPKKGKREEFALELVSGSRILIQSVHGYFVGSREASHVGIGPSFPTHTDGISTSNWRCSSSLASFVDSSPGAWRLRAHGDSHYTLVAAMSPRDRGDIYMCVDNKGKLLQSNEPAVFFPSSSSLFEIKPVTRSSLEKFDDIALHSNERDTIVGFSIKTIRKINGKQRYLNAEPNGTLRVNCVCISRWETFRLLDVDATASAVFPNEFLCVPAAVNNTPVTYLSNRGLPQGIGNALSFLDGQVWVGGISQSGNCLVGKCIQSVESLIRASQVAAMATRMGRCLPARTPASLELLCINQICLQVSAEVAELAKSQGTCSAAWVTESLVESCAGIPDDLISKIILHWCSRQQPESPCKTLVRTALSRRGHLSLGHGNGHGARPSTLLEHPHWDSSGQGFSCHSCNQSAILKMDPKVNPAHHRYLEVQYHAQNGITQPTGFLWNLISFVGVSIMSGALLVHFCTDRNRKQRASRPVR